VTGRGPHRAVRCWGPGGGRPVAAYFGSETLQRVERIQAQDGDPPDGELGPKQAARLMPADLGYQIVKDTTLRAVVPRPGQPAVTAAVISSTVRTVAKRPASA
jgi:peptidoglycan hydrolase-like protein with peptidoglycan-binding domain